MHEARLGSGAVRRMMMRQVSRAFEKWQRDAAAMKAEQMAVRRGLMRMIHARMGASFATWRSVAEEQKHSVRLGGGAIQRTGRC